MYTAMKVTIIALALLTAATVTAQAQNNASINVSAAVQQPIVVLAGPNLTFGPVFPGVPKAIALGSPSAGRFDVTGQASAPVSMTFVVPSNLTFGANNLPIASWVGSWNGLNDPAGSGFTPSAGATAATFSGTGTLFVFVGATVTPSVSQVAGAYVGTVQMTVTY